MISTPKPLTTEGPKCIGQYELFDGVDVENEDGDLIGQWFPYEAQAKDLCKTCPALAWCRQTRYPEPYTIVAGLTPQERPKRRKR